jgi:hypothetical protein
LAYPLLTTLLSSSASTLHPPSGLSTYLDVLKHLPPTLSTFDLLGRLLRDSTIIMDHTTGGTTTIADLVRTEVLGWFIHGSIDWLDDAERDEREGLVSDDRFAKGVQNVSPKFLLSLPSPPFLILFLVPNRRPTSHPSQFCRFYNSLIKLGILDPSSDADSVEMAHFALRNARFEEANALYRAIVMGKF